jgi:hypothetical protein
MNYCDNCASTVNLFRSFTFTGGINDNRHFCGVCVETRRCSACDDFFDDEEIITIQVKGKPAPFCYTCKQERDNECKNDLREYRMYREEFE